MFKKVDSDFKNYEKALEEEELLKHCGDAEHCFLNLEYVIPDLPDKQPEDPPPMATMKSS